MAAPTRTGGGVVTLYAGTITAAGTVVGGTVNAGGVINVASQAAFTYGSGGTTAKAYIQTSLDNGTTWIDCTSYAFATTTAVRVFRWGMAAGSGTAQVTPTDGSLTDNTMVNGIVGDLLRVKVISTGTYAGNTTLTVTAALKGA